MDVFCKETNNAAKAAGFIDGDCLVNNPVCPNCHLANAMVTRYVKPEPDSRRIPILICRSCSWTRHKFRPTLFGQWYCDTCDSAYCENL